MPGNLHCCPGPGPGPGWGCDPVADAAAVADSRFQIPDSEKMKIDALHLKRPVIISQASIALHLPHRPKYVRDLHLMRLLLLLLMDIYIKVPAPLLPPLPHCLPLCCSHTHCGPTGRMRNLPAAISQSCQLPWRCFLIKFAQALPAPPPSLFFLLLIVATTTIIICVCCVCVCVCEAPVSQSVYKSCRAIDCSQLSRRKAIFRFSHFHIFTLSTCD